MDDAYSRSAAAAVDKAVAKTVNRALGASRLSGGKGDPGETGYKAEHEDRFKIDALNLTSTDNWGNCFVDC